ncbi:MAG: calcium/sodium antiporter [Sedimentisphaerales bacterium]|nr:calcium/sodium antiporter [Sedimentisphaerales bacterium]
MANIGFIAGHLLIIIVSCLALGKGAAWLVDAAARIARRMGISELVIGLTIVAFGTSAPEFAVTISAALRGDADVGVANIIGSNIFNIGFILGGCALAMNVVTSRALVWRDGGLLLAISILLLPLMHNGELGRWESLALLFIMIAYIALLFVKREKLELEKIPEEPASWRDPVFLILGLALIFAGGQALPWSAVKLAEMIGMSKWVIGLTVVAAGTSLPEFVVSLTAILKKHHGISAGNLVGSNLFNTLGVLGLAGLIKPLSVDSSAQFSLMAQVGITAVVVLFMATGKKIVRWEGIVLILLSMAVWGYNFYLGRPAG